MIQQVQLSQDQVEAALKSSSLLQFKISRATFQVRTELLGIISTILKMLNRDFLSASIRYIVNELVYNAEKANLKRAFFHTQHLDIENSESYATGMKSFGDTIGDEERFSDEFDTLALFTEIAIQVSKNRLLIKVINSTVPTPQEVQRLLSRFALARTVREVADLFEKAKDPLEGAGLGTVTSLVILRKLDMPDNALQFTVDTKAKQTVFQLAVPLDRVTVKEAQEISDKVAKEIASIPSYPENIQKIQQLLNSLDVEFYDIANLIQKDPALTTELLKTVNSALYMLPQKVTNIQNAASLIGIKGLRSLLVSLGAHTIIQQRYGRLIGLDKQLSHAYRCAAYAYGIAERQKLGTVADDIFIGGLLHDIGKIMILSLDPTVFESATATIKRLGEGGELIERLCLGVSHEIIGAKVAQKWNFPDSLVAIIEYHHHPLQAPDNYKQITAIVSVANYLTNMIERSQNIVHPDDEVLALCGVNDLQHLCELGIVLEKIYQGKVKR